MNSRLNDTTPKFLNMEPRNRQARGTAEAQTDDLRARLDRARRTLHQARLIADGQTLAAGPWRSDHLAAVVDRRRILDYIEEHRVAGAAEIHSTLVGGAA